MTRIFYIFILCSFAITYTQAQDQTADERTSGISYGSQMIDDNKTVDPEQNSEWRSGDYPYSAKPKDMWELGLNVGHSFISGDVEPQFLSGVGFGVHLRKAINYNISVRASANYYSARGIDARPTGISVIKKEKFYRQNNLGGRFEGVSSIHRNYKTKVWGGGIEAVINMGNILFHRPSTKWNFNIAGGIGFEVPTTTLNIFDGSSNYNWGSVTQGLNLTTKEDRKTARERIEDMLDDSWETDGGVENTIKALGDDKTIYPTFLGSVGVARKINDRLNIGLRHQIVFADNDLLDSYEYRDQVDQSNNLDLLHYTSLSLNINLGSFDKRTEPLYWLNPLSSSLMDLAEVKSRPELDLTDTDEDGVIDMLDQEPDTPDGAPVDVRGVALDSDDDGIADYMDKEPFSSPGFDVDQNGVAIMPDDGYMTEDEINSLVNSKLDNIRTEWFLPMVNFDLNKYYVKPEFYGALHQVATVMNTHPDVKVLVKGFTDNRGDMDYNRVLSYKRANATIDYLVDRYNLPRERFIIQYGGEEHELIPELEDTHDLEKREEMQQYLNRRVEFYIAKPGDESMEKPEGPDAGEGTPGSSRAGSKYSGNRNSGY